MHSWQINEILYLDNTVDFFHIAKKKIFLMLILSVFLLSRQ